LVFRSRPHAMIAQCPLAATAGSTPIHTSLTSGGTGRADDRGPAPPPGAGGGTSRTHPSRRGPTSTSRSTSSGLPLAASCQVHPASSTRARAERGSRSPRRSRRRGSAPGTRPRRTPGARRHRSGGNSRAGRTSRSGRSPPEIGCSCADPREEDPAGRISFATCSPRSRVGGPVRRDARALDLRSARRRGRARWSPDLPRVSVPLRG
jgi:hypothetical protein